MHDVGRGVLHHIELNVQKLERSLAFWGWLLEALGYEPYQSWEQGRSWKQGPCYLVFVQTREKHLAAGYHRCRTGLNHLAFRLSSQAELARFEAELAARGVPFLYQERSPHAGGPDSMAIFFEDPDRIKVELVVESSS